MISVIVPMYNSQKTIALTIDSVLNSDCNDYEIIIVDDGSVDRSVEIASEYPVQLIKLDRNGGPAKARNIGASRAKGDLLFFVDSDVVLRPDTLSKLAETIESEDIHAVVGIYQKEPLNKGFFQKFKALHNWNYSKVRHREIYPHSVFSSFCAMIKKDVFDDIGGFDIIYSSNDVEDYEIGRRLIDKGYNLVRHSGVEVAHHFPSFSKGVRIYISRAFLWTDLFLKWWKFDTGGTAIWDAIGMTAGCLAVLFLLFHLVIPGLLSLAVFLLCFLSLFLLFYQTEGLLFMLKGGLVQIVLAVLVFFSSLCAALSYPFRKS